MFHNGCANVIARKKATATPANPRISRARSSSRCSRNDIRSIPSSSSSSSSSLLPEEEEGGGGGGGSAAFTTGRFSATVVALYEGSGAPYRLAYSSGWSSTVNETGSPAVTPLGAEAPGSWPYLVSVFGVVGLFGSSAIQSQSQNRCASDHPPGTPLIQAGETITSFGKSRKLRTGRVPTRTTEPTAKADAVPPCSPQSRHHAGRSCGQ